MLMRSNGFDTEWSFLAAALCLPVLFWLAELANRSRMCPHAPGPLKISRSFS